MNNRAKQGGWVILLSFLLAMVLMILPLPESMKFLRPNWILLVLIYWMMALPSRVGIGTAWIVGLLMDVLLGGILGVTALVYALIAFLILAFHLQLRQYPLWQQGIWIFLLIFFNQLVLVVKAMGTVSWYEWWLPAAVSTILWPIIFAILRWSRRSFHVT